MPALRALEEHAADLVTTARVFATDVLVCDARGGAMRILAILPEGDASRAILEHLGLPTEPPPPGAVGPPDPVRHDALA